MLVRVCWVFAVACAVLGVAAGLVTSTVSPQGRPVACGPALFHNWFDLPSTDCALAHQPFQTIATVLLVGSLIMAAAGFVFKQNDAETGPEENSYSDVKAQRP
jgi:hypothetical protein